MRPNEWKTWITQSVYLKHLFTFQSHILYLFTKYSNEFISLLIYQYVMVQSVFFSNTWVYILSCGPPNLHLSSIYKWETKVFVAVNARVSKILMFSLFLGQNGQLHPRSIYIWATTCLHQNQWICVSWTIWHPRFN